MSIRFVCEHCGQKLSVNPSKAGARAKCPKCHEPIVVPMPQPAADQPPVEPAAAEQAEQADAAAAASEGYADPFAQFMVYDDTELVYESEPADDIPEAEPGWIDPNKVAVPRSILYAQGVLLGLVCLASFSLGVIVGRQSAPKANPADLGPQPCSISGSVVFKDSRGDLVPDGGAVVIVLPKDARPEMKTDLSGLLPHDPPPEQDHPGLQSIESIGGDYARADDAGKYQLGVQDVGDYFLLVISANRPQSEVERPPSEFAQIGRFFQLGPDLFGGDDYHWSEITVRRDREIQEVFQ